MSVIRLTLTDFRNHAVLTHMPQQNFIVLHGANGAGKTNILEALSLLVPGRGLRRAAMADMARTGGQGGFTVNAEIENAIIGTGTLATHPERRVVRINESTAPINSLAQWLSIIWLTPAMDRLFVEAPSGRRQFFDRMVLALSPDHATHASRYDRALRQRNRLLGQDETPDPMWLDALEIAMAENGAQMNAARLALLVALRERLAHLPDSPFAVPNIGFDTPLIAGEDALLAQWRAGRARDRAAARTLIGPHRMDFIVRHSAKDQPAAQCSTGEQKALLLSLILAHAAIVAEGRGKAPILLLDEIAAHLDPLRREALFDRLAQTGGQVWMTGTEVAPFESIGSAGHFIAVG